ncbi:MAG TPA: N(5)-(carboxyethyl)ornithine synthase [Saprospiraceae bacterium]|nr:N(5)-(carboxyethyl)ornithine synthase [Saprospiraceae bacterium]
MDLLSVSVFGTSSKAHEKRVPIHPEQISWIDEKVRKKLFFEEGYGLPFDMSDEELAALSAGVLPRETLFERGEILLLPKPVQEDFDAMRPQSILWGWPHCVQQEAFTQAAIDRKLTLIAWEAMHRWNEQGDWKMHIFQKNNEIAGYAGVLHALSLIGLDGNYGPHRKAVVISFGSVSRGAIHGLRALGINDITVFTQRYSIFVTDQMTSTNYYHYEQDDLGRLMAVYPDGEVRPFVEALEEADVIVNGILQDTDHPIMFMQEGQEERLKKGTLIVDISCDEGMGFPFAKPTTFDAPMFKKGHVHYYAVDHTPSYLWNSASWEISNSLLPYLPLVMQGPKRWMESETLKRAIEIKEGIIQNPKILSFQNREADYPHVIKE